MFGSSFNGQPKQASTNTRLATWSCDSSCLQIRLWDDNLSLTFNVCTGKNADGRNQYDFQNKVTTAITPERAIEIAEFVSNAIRDIEDASRGASSFEPSNIAFDVGTKGNRLVFSCEMDGDEPSAFVRIHNLNPDGKSNDVITYKFKHYVYFKDYNPETGSANKFQREDELAMFLRYLNMLRIVAEGKYKNHSTRYNRATEAMYANGGNQQNGGFGNNANSSNGSNSGNASSTYSAQTVTAGDDYPF